MKYFITKYIKWCIRFAYQLLGLEQAVTSVTTSKLCRKITVKSIHKSLNITVSLLESYHVMLVTVMFVSVTVKNHQFPGPHDSETGCDDLLKNTALKGYFKEQGKYRNCTDVTEL